MCLMCDFTVMSNYSSIREMKEYKIMCKQFADSGLCDFSCALTRFKEKIMLNGPKLKELCYNLLWVSLEEAS